MMIGNGIVVHSRSTRGHAETPELTEGDGQGATDAAVRKRQSCPFFGTVPFHPGNDMSLVSPGLT
jgi:hypothetical protein